MFGSALWDFVTWIVVPIGVLVFTLFFLRAAHLFWLSQSKKKRQDLERLLTKYRATSDKHEKGKLFQDMLTLLPVATKAGDATIDTVVAYMNTLPKD